MNTANNNPNAIAPGHNPKGLTISQVPPGHRLLDPDEVGPQFATCRPMHEIKRWDGEKFSGSWWIGCDDGETYCTTLTRAELRVRRVRPPEEPGEAPTPDAPVLMRDMTLLDWFAGQALAGVLADPSNTSSTDTIASFAYAQAEALLAERNRRAGK